MLGLHFRSPVFKAELVEIVRGFATSDETFEIGRAFVESIGKIGIEVFESPGGVTTRVILPLINEAMYVLLEGVANAGDIDTAMRVGFNMEIGPLELTHQDGWQSALLVLRGRKYKAGLVVVRPELQQQVHQLLPITTTLTIDKTRPADTWVQSCWPLLSAESQPRRR